MYVRITYARYVCMYVAYASWFVGKFSKLTAIKIDT
jgi:hypothetical protein